jgi:hypothetical protein
MGRAQQDFFRKEAAAENCMLKVNFTETPTEQRWILQGRLIGPWVRELRASWKNNHRNDERRACIVDLHEITFIDKSGERLLRLLVREGAQCVASGVYIKHVLDRLAARATGRLLNRSARKGLSALANREVEMIEEALAESHGRISGPSGAASKLGIARQTLESARHR